MMLALKLRFLARTAVCWCFVMAELARSRDEVKLA